MPCLAIHLAVAEEYLKQHPEENREEFLLGSIAPDLTNLEIGNEIVGVGTDKNSRHFGKITNSTNDPIEYMKRKVNFSRFLSLNNIKTSFQRAYFLHLICDDLFYGEYITSEDVKGITLEQAKEMCYRDYNRITAKLIQQFHLTIPDMMKDIISHQETGALELLKEDVIDQFILDLSHIDIDEFQKHISS